MKAAARKVDADHFVEKYCSRLRRHIEFLGRYTQKVHFDFIYWLR